MSRAIYFASAISAALIFASAATAQELPDFGDDGSEWANDGECDDPRFSGAGMTDTPLLDKDAFHDATDCEAAFLNGDLVLKAGAETTAPVYTPADPDDLIFGDDASEWANDDECDDPRFIGDGMAEDPLLEEDRFHDATDCEAAFAAGTIRIRTAEDDVPPEPVLVDIPEGLVFGDDSSRWAYDDQCDDPRFEGDAAAAKMLDEDLGRDAQDCRIAFETGSVTLVEGGMETPVPSRRPASLINFGDNTSRWSGDAECDDPRFVGRGSAMKLDPADEKHDAMDCRAAYENGRIRLR